MRDRRQAGTYGGRTFGRLATGFVATFSRRTNLLTGPAKVIDGDTIVVADQLVRLHGIDAPELDQTFWWRGQQIACGTMSLAFLEMLTAGVKARCEMTERDRHGRLVAKVFSPNGVDIGRRLVSAGVGPGVPAVLEGRRRRLGAEGRARYVAGASSSLVLAAQKPIAGLCPDLLSPRSVERALPAIVVDD
jgi:endonuclease YncB( thermonuclease family)